MRDWISYSRNFVRGLRLWLGLVGMRAFFRRSPAPVVVCRSKNGSTLVILQGSNLTLLPARELQLTSMDGLSTWSLRRYPPSPMSERFGSPGRESGEVILDGAGRHTILFTSNGRTGEAPSQISMFPAPRPEPQSSTPTTVIGYRPPTKT